MGTELKMRGTEDTLHVFAVWWSHPWKILAQPGAGSDGDSNGVDTVIGTAV